jgi:hypothetical protein
VTDGTRRTGAGAGRSLLVALACAAFVIAAVVLEAIAGGAANSPLPAWAEGLFPLSWPRPVRAGWWLAVAAAALGFRIALVDLGLAKQRLLTAATVAPFVILAAGVAFGADWATWH